MASKSNNNINKQKDKLVVDLENNIKKLDDALDSLKVSVDQLQKGDGKFPYWNGSNACTVLKTTLTQYQIDKSLLKNIRECKGSIKK